MDKTTWRSTRDAYGDALVEAGRTHPELIVLTADLMHSTKLEDFQKKWPARFHNVGIAEQNMVGIAAGLATCGKVPLVSTFACFASMRACEQVRTDVAYPNLNVKIVGTHAGISMGAGGTTHHATEDIAIMRAMANMTVLVPADASETRGAVEAMVQHAGPVYMRLGRDPDPVIAASAPLFQIGKASILREGCEVTIVAIGRLVAESLVAADKLERRGISTGVINMSTVKPLDTAAVLAASRTAQLMVTAEEHNIIGGLGSAVAEVLAETCACPVRRIGIRDCYSVIGGYEELLAAHDLTGAQMAEQIAGWLRGRATHTAG